MVVSMQESWQFLVTTVIPIFALMTAISARNEAKKANRIVAEAHKRNELNQYYPALKFSSEIVDEKIHLVIANASNSNSASLEKIRYNIFLQSGDYKFDKEGFIELDEVINSNSEKKIPFYLLNENVEGINSVVLKMTSQKAGAVSIRLKAWLEYKPTIYEGKKVVEYFGITYSYENGKFNLSGPIRY
ncbi:hypothetical protein EOW58_24890 [Salmonella enterica]|nr:hypothetical protein [Salmonella enterica]EAS9238001.1 hypothetical protein [Salmonella enterica subsp. enterica]